MYYCQKYNLVSFKEYTMAANATPLRYILQIKCASYDMEANAVQSLANVARITVFQTPCLTHDVPNSAALIMNKNDCFGWCV